MIRFSIFWSLVIACTILSVTVAKNHQRKQEKLKARIAYEQESLKKVPQKYHRSVRFYSAYFGLPLHIIANLGKAESDWNEQAYGYNHHNNSYDYGLFQLNSRNFEWFNTKYFKKIGVRFNPKNPKHNMYVGLHYISDLVKEFNGDIYLALCSYNWGIGNVRSGARIPQIVDTYAKKILGDV